MNHYVFGIQKFLFQKYIPIRIFLSNYHQNIIVEKLCDINEEMNEEKMVIKKYWFVSGFESYTEKIDEGSISYMKKGL